MENLTKPKETKKSGSNFAIRLIREVSSYKGRIILLFGLTILAALLNILPPLLLSFAIDNYILKGDFFGLILMLVALIALGALIAVQSYFQRILSQYIGLNVVKNLRNQLFEHISHLPFEFFDKNTTGDLVARVTSDTDQLSMFLNVGFVNFMVNLFMLFGIMGVLFVWDYRFGLIFLGLFPLMIYGVQLFTKKLLPAVQRNRKTNAALTTSIQECFNGIREVKLYGREEYMEETFRKWNDEYFDAVIEANKWNSIWSPFVPFILSIFSVFFVMMGTYLVIGSNITVGELVAVITYFGLLGGPIRAVTGFANIYNTTKAAADRIFETMDHIPSIKDREDAIPVESLEGHLEFRDVHFWYNKNAEILSGITFTANPGETVALVGPSGVGKTTVAHLVPRFYDVTEGAVLIDGTDVRQFQLKSLRKNVGIVMQNVFLFDGTIAENIAYGKPEATIEEIENAAKIAQLDDFIETLPQKYDTEIEERGLRLSGGQAQRLSIARVLLTNPRLLILDEPTANVDAITDQKLIQSVRAVMEGRTTIIIAHRLWTIKNADKIVLLKDGKIEAMGSHQELLGSSAFYREFFASQLQRDDLNNNDQGGEESS
ncbi:MAG TPA: ABC transporter ATP-binding protein [Candidatus Lokiarchaeia archaeon]|nr:ABC transporter ATP-binding protein [Candidatus Lokiarchaeia archaeon]